MDGGRGGGGGKGGGVGGGGDKRGAIKAVVEPELAPVDQEPLLMSEIGTAFLFAKDKI